MLHSKIQWEDIEEALKLTVPVSCSKPLITPGGSSDDCLFLIQMI